MYYAVLKTSKNSKNPLIIPISEQVVESDELIFTPEEEKFLAMFDANKAVQLGVIYSLSDIGIQEFIQRSGKQYNCTPDVLNSLIKSKIIRIEPYGGIGRDTDYTIKLVGLKLADLKGFAEKAGIQSGGESSDTSGGAGSPDMSMGAPPPPASPASPAPEATPEPAAEEEPTPAPENAGVVKYGTILSESVKSVKHVLLEKKQTVDKVYTDESRILKNLPTEYIKHLNRVITYFTKKQFSTAEKKKLIADIIDNLALNLNLSPKQIFMSYEMHKKQKKLQKYLNKE